MKLWLAVPVFLSFTAINAHAQTATAKQQPAAAATTSAAATKIDPAKEADIRKLLDLVGTKALAAQSIESMTKSIKPVLTNSLPPGDYREKLVDLFFAKFSSKANLQHLLDMAIPIYDRHFLHQEISNLITFYPSPI